MSVSGTMTMFPKNWFQPPIRRSRRVKYGLTPPLQHFRRRPRLLTSVESAAGHIPVWKPVGVPTTKVLLLGDLNSGGKVRFGQDKGTLRRALPGAGHFHSTIEDLPPPNCEVFSEVSDVIISVGTNNFKLPSSEPEAIANQL